MVTKGWRLCIGLIATLGAVLLLAAHKFGEGFNRVYFPESLGSTSLDASEIIGIASIIYLLLVAVTGRWRILKTTDK